MKKKETDSVYTEIETRIIPRASRNEIVGIENGVARIRVTSPPVDGKANKAVTELLSKQLGVPKKDVRIVSGEKSRNKKIRIYGISSLEFSKSAE
jgi:uncharacterized protein (TIGR00251 family)